MNAEKALIERDHAAPYGPVDAGAESAKSRIIARLQDLASTEVQEFQCSPKSDWETLVLHALLKRYGIQPYRYRKQRRSTVIVRVGKPFMNEVLWPIYIATRRDHCSRIFDIADGD